MTAATPGGLDPETSERLLRSARAARQNAYAPYSNFPVGAALLAEDGRVFTGVNVENASFGLTTCAERTAVTKAISEGARGFLAIAVIGPEDQRGCPPCGSCRQILHEVAPSLVVITAGNDGEPREARLADLLPQAFGGERLGPARAP